MYSLDHLHVFDKVLVCVMNGCVKDYWFLINCYIYIALLLTLITHAMTHLYHHTITWNPY